MAAPAGRRPAAGPDAPDGARVHNYWLGGHVHFEADRRLARQIEQIVPEVRQMAVDAYLFHARAAGYAAAAGIRQFAVLGGGLPPRPALHEVARSVQPGSVCVYVDPDPAACDHTLDLLDDGERDGITVACADPAGPETVLPVLRETLDLGERVCLVASGVPHHLPPGRARAVLAAYVTAAAPGSVLAVAVPHLGGGVPVRQLTAAYTPARIRSWTRGTLTRLLGGLELVPPGVAPAAGLRPGWGDAPDVPERGACVIAAVARKP